MMNKIIKEINSKLESLNSILMVEKDKSSFMPDNIYNVVFRTKESFIQKENHPINLTNNFFVFLDEIAKNHNVRIGHNNTITTFWFEDLS